MKLNIRLRLGSAVFAGAVLSASFTGAQQTRQSVAQRSEFYSTSRETVLQGTVMSYTAASTVPPLGAHAMIQTASGPVDVHLGSAKLLESSHFTVTTGDTLRIIGENLSYGDGTHFVARVIQKGNLSLAVRSERGFLLQPVGGKAPVAKGGAF